MPCLTQNARHARPFNGTILVEVAQKIMGAAKIRDRWDVIPRRRKKTPWFDLLADGWRRN